MTFERAATIYPEVTVRSIRGAIQAAVLAHNGRELAWFTGRGKTIDEAVDAAFQTIRRPFQPTDGAA